jgi:hypothetical protein
MVGQAFVIGYFEPKGESVVPCSRQDKTQIKCGLPSVNYGGSQCKDLHFIFACLKHLLLALDPASCREYARYPFIRTRDQGKKVSLNTKAGQYQITKARPHHDIGQG